MSNHRYDIPSSGFHFRSRDKYGELRAKHDRIRRRATSALLLCGALFLAYAIIEIAYARQDKINAAADQAGHRNWELMQH